MNKLIKLLLHSTLLLTTTTLAEASAPTPSIILVQSDSTQTHLTIYGQNLNVGDKIFLAYRGDITSQCNLTTPGSVITCTLALALQPAGRRLVIYASDGLTFDFFDLATGVTGPAGATGPQGPTGLTGATGLTGPTGLTGDIGPVGAVGATGPIGPIGPAGAQGTAGLKGDTGLTGPAGSVGPAGATGPIGPNGLKGDIGPIGQTGPAGAVGATGANGQTGPAGAIGPGGPQGSPGATGPIGNPGSSGPQGPIGTFSSAGLTVLHDSWNVPAHTNIERPLVCPTGQVVVGAGGFVYDSTISGYTGVPGYPVPVNQNPPNGWNFIGANYTGTHDLGLYGWITCSL